MGEEEQHCVNTKLKQNAMICESQIDILSTIEHRKHMKCSNCDMLLFPEEYQLILMAATSYKSLTGAAKGWRISGTKSKQLEAHVHQSAQQHYKYTLFSPKSSR